MKYNPDTHHRRSIRLKEYDYSQNGAYFITICVQNKECLFGGIIDNEMILNNAGKMIEKWWYEMKSKYPNIELDCFVVMPNHIHGILVVGENKTGQTQDKGGQTHRSAPTDNNNVNIIVGANLCVRPNIRMEAIATGYSK